LDSQRRLYVGQSGFILRVIADQTVEYLVAPRFGSAERAADGDFALTVAAGGSSIAVDADGILYFAGLLRVTPNGLRYSLWKLGADGLIHPFVEGVATAMAFSPRGLLFAQPGGRVYLAGRDEDRYAREIRMAAIKTQTAPALDRRCRSWKYFPAPARA